MRPTRPFRFALGVVLLTSVAVTGCGDDGDDSVDTGSGSGSGDEPAFASIDTIDQGTLAVCSDVPYEPFEFEGDGPSGYTGFDIEVLQAAAATVDLELTVSDVEFDGILGNLEAETCDAVASAVTINDERAEQVDFTDPYFDAEQSLLVKTDSDVTSLDDLAGETIGVQAGTTGEAYANDNTPEGAQVKSYDGADALFAAMESGDIAAILQDFPVNAYRTTQDDSLEVVEEYETGEQYGFAVKKGNESLLTALDDGLAEIRDNGEYDDLYEKYFGTAPTE